MTIINRIHLCFFMRIRGSFFGTCKSFSVALLLNSSTHPDSFSNKPTTNWLRDWREAVFLCNVLFLFDWWLTRSHLSLSYGTSFLFEILANFDWSGSVLLSYFMKLKIAPWRILKACITMTHKSQPFFFF